MIKFSHSKLSSISLSNQHYIDKFLKDNNYTLNMSNNLDLVKEVLTSQSEDEYPYRFDSAFNKTYIGDADYFCLFLKYNSKIIATYAAREVNLKNYLADMRNYFHNDTVSTNVELESKEFSNTWYSSLQWVSNSHRGKNIGLILDFIKKSIIFECFNGNINFSTHNVALNSYHKNKLMYNNTEWFMTIINGEAGRKDDKSEKIYNISYIENTHWQNIKDEIYNTYIPIK